MAIDSPTAPATAAPPTRRGLRSHGHPGLVLTLILSVQLMVVLDATIVNIALPDIRTALHFSPSSLSWVINAYTLTFGGLLLLGARAGDILGRRRTFLAGITLFTLASLVGGFAASSGELLAARAAQGIGAALASPSALALLMTMFPQGRERTRAIGLYTAVSIGGSAVAEHVVGLAPERWLNHAVSTRAFLAVPADYAYAYAYATLHYAVTLAVLIWLWRAHPTAYLPARRTLTAATLLGLAGFATVPLAPPRMLPGFIDTISRYGNDGWWGATGSAPKGLGSFTNQFAAMPSLHVGWAIWCGWMAARLAQRAWVRRLAVAYPVVAVLVVLSTGNHYLLDAVAGLLVLLTGDAISRTAVRLGWLKPAPTLIGT